MFNLIQLYWEGPLTLEQVKSKNSDDQDYGIYAIYGTHPVFGPDSLLYIGQADSATFSGRISGHEEWIDREATLPIFYLGRIANIDQSMSDYDWGTVIDNAEKIIIYDCTPPYNSRGLNNYTPTSSGPTKNNGKLIEEIPTDEEIKKISQFLVINLGARHRIPLYCSSFSLEIPRKPKIYRRSDY